MHKLLSIIIVAFFLSSSFNAHFIGDVRTIANHQPASQPELDENEIYLPIIIRPMAPPVFGVETHTLQDWKLNAAQAADVHWLRNAAFDWDKIEPIRKNPPEYQWPSAIETGLREAVSKNLTVIATIKYAPAWAQREAGWFCGPIKQDALDSFAQFVKAAVVRYSAYPYNVRYWEIGNEVDYDRNDLIYKRNVFGCWGDSSDAYFGGGYYAEMLKRVYPAVKAANPTAQVMIGGLWLKCDPTDPPPGETCKSAKFLEGILRNGGAPYFDVVSFHTYVGFGPLDKKGTDDELKIRDLDNPSFQKRGGQINGKANFLQSVLTTYGVNKPLFLTEVSLSCDDDDPVYQEKFCTTQQELFWDMQADFVVTSHLRSWGLGMMGAIWYTLEDSTWRDTGLHTPESIPKPGYAALQFMAEELKEGTLKEPIIEYEGLRGYKFQALTKNVWVLWSPDGATGVAIPLPSGTTAVYDKYGASLPLTDPIEVVHPTYFEFPL